jgi:hypothetical protein
LYPENVKHVEVRTAAEIRAVWRQEEKTKSHIILIGHGNEESIRLLDHENPMTGQELGKLLDDAAPTTSPKTVVSLSCLTGRQPFAKPFSRSRTCADFLAPFQSVHSAAASLFAQSFFGNHFLYGQGVVAAYRQAREAVAFGASFRHWRNGSMRPTSAKPGAKD